MRGIVQLQNAGTLRLTANIANLGAAAAGGVLLFNLGTGGGTIDTQAFNTALDRVVQGTGSLTKAGTGTLTLSGVNTHTGGTTVAAGTLVIGATGAVAVGAAGLTVSTTGAAVQVDGTLNLTSATATLVNNGGTLTLGAGSVLNLNNLFDGQTDGATYALITGSTASTAGTFGVITGYAGGLNVTFDNTTGLLAFTAIPEPSAYGLLGAGALAGLAAVRRRRHRA